jgi:hypothetical protein
MWQALNLGSIKVVKSRLTIDTKFLKKVELIWQKPVEYVNYFSIDKSIYLKLKLERKKEVEEVLTNNNYDYPTKLLKVVLEWFISFGIYFQFQKTFQEV